MIKREEELRRAYPGHESNGERHDQSFLGAFAVRDLDIAPGHCRGEPDKSSSTAVLPLQRPV
jgi:hypothetical protein